MDSNTLKGSIILLVEDEENLAIGLQYNLTEEGYRVIRAADGKQALEFFDPQGIDLVILDIMLPRMDGFKVAERIREQSMQIPILMLTARTAAIDRVRGLETGADDYLVKPFHLRELLLRVRGMLKRKKWYRQVLEEASTYRFCGNEINFSALHATTSKRSIQLTPLESMLLKYFIDHAGQIISREELLKEVWQTTSKLETRTVDNFIVRLRKYFEPDPAHPVFFQNIRGAGYLFSPED